MADYYPLVAKAVAGLEKNTGEGRRLLYERARTALVAQLRGMNDPPLTEAEITRERLALEEAIRKVEAEAARRGRDAPRPEQPAAPAPKAEAKAPPPPARPAPSPSPERATAAPRSRAPSRSVTDEGLKGFRDVIAEANRSAMQPHKARRPPARPMRRRHPLVRRTLIGSNHVWSPKACVRQRVLPRGQASRLRERASRPSARSIRLRVRASPQRVSRRLARSMRRQNRRRTGRSQSESTRGPASSVKVRCGSHRPTTSTICRAARAPD